MRKIKAVCFYLMLCLLILGISSCKQPSVEQPSDSEEDSLPDSDSESESSKADDPPVEDPPVVLEPREEFAMEHTLKMLKNENQLKIAYIGGSVTSGTGIEETEKYSWRALTTAWFKEQYPDAHISEVSASIGGTGSLLGVFRYDYEVLDEEPDLIFIEFAINDCHEGRSYKDAVSTMEGMVRKTLRSRPCADIVIVLTTDEMRGTSEFDSMRAHADVAKAYGIPYICVGKELASHIFASGEAWETYFTDYVHPNINGYAFYATVVRARLEKLLNGTEKAAYVTPEYPLGTTDYLNAGILLPKQVMKDATADGFSRQFQSFSWVGERYGGILTAMRKDATLTFTFTGTDFGLFYNTAPDAGTVSIEVDGKPFHKVDAYAQKQFPCAALWTQELSAGTHTVTIRVTGQNPSSSGCKIDIGAILYR